ncbi:fruit-body specific gene C [Macrolepiota fuliginosa MF-IS2]|uniref:Fruit-body specific gene C n=1 Tax=Macrolepiota fuliginosa MF-IS2 TaxID=1400762 RepID=A0A9P6C2N0_9AGAR|nr:fruit-body specific gene C [Macrolepiota fuliginosa MF-IS2]
MTNSGEFWLAYQFASRGNAAPTSQLIELDYPHQKLIDLEDVLEYVFRQGFVEARHRPVTTWVRKDGAPVRPSDVVDELLKQGVGKCSETAIKLVIEDVPTQLWFTYYYVHSPNAKVSIQRVRLNQGFKFEHLAHLTNYVFGQGYLPAYYRPLVHWQAPCGKKLSEDVHVIDILSNGDGVTENKAIKLIIDAHQFHPHHPHSPCDPHHHHHIPSPCTPSRPGTPAFPIPHPHHSCPL